MQKKAKKDNQNPAPIVRTLQPVTRYEKVEPLEVALDIHVSNRLAELAASRNDADNALHFHKKKIEEAEFLKRSIAITQDELIRFDIKRAGVWSDYTTPIEISTDFRIIRVICPPVPVKKEV